MVAALRHLAPLAEIRLLTTATGDRVETRLARGTCAAVFVIEHAGFTEHNYREGLRRFIRETGIRRDFRLLIFHADDESALQQSAEARDLLRELNDVELPEEGIANESSARADPLREIAVRLERHLGLLDDLRRADAWQRTRNWTMWISGWTATLCQLIAAAAVVACVGTFMLGLPHADAAVRPLAALLIGISSVVPILNLAAYMSRIPFTRIDGVVYPDAPTEAVCWLILIAIIAHQLGLSANWVALGLVYGAFVDAIRRGGLQAQRMRLVLSPFERPRDDRWWDWSRLQRRALTERLPMRMVRVITTATPGLLSCAVLPVRVPRVFISYTRSSNWSRETARRLRDALQAGGALCFLDKDAIEVGVNWRAVLNEEVGLSNVLIAILDEDTLSRKWPAAEIEAALTGKSLTGSPEIILLVEPSLFVDSRPLAEWLPVFRVLLGQARHLEQEAQPRLIKASDTAIASIAHQIAPERYVSVAVLPGGLARTLRALWAGPSALAGTLGLIPPLTFQLAIPPALAELSGYTHVAAMLSSPTLIAVAAFSAFSAGHATRAAIGARFQSSQVDARATYRTYMWAAAGAAMVFAACCLRLDSAAIGWSLVGAVVGWREAGERVLHERSPSTAFAVRLPGGE